MTFNQTAITFPDPKEVAIELSYQATSEVWKEKAIAFLLSYAIEGREFITEDVRIASKEILPEIKEERAWGYLMRLAKKMGIIADTGKFREMKSLQSHSCPKKVWVGKVKISQYELVK